LSCFVSTFVCSTTVFGVSFGISFFCSAKFCETMSVKLLVVFFGVVVVGFFSSSSSIIDKFDDLVETSDVFF